MDHDVTHGEHRQSAGGLLFGPPGRQPPGGRPWAMGLGLWGALGLFVAPKAGDEQYAEKNLVVHLSLPVWPDEPWTWSP